MSILVSTRRLDPLTNGYVLVSPSRMSRPWSQNLDSITEEKLPAYQKSCYLCPNNQRINGVVNPDYKDTFLFENDFPSLSPLESKLPIINNSSHLFVETPERGKCEVLCYTPKHNVNISNLSIDQIVNIIKLWIKRYIDLSNTKNVGHIQIFETRGKEVGNSAPHPHCQIWTQESIPSLPDKIYTNQKKYYKKNHKKLLLDYVNQEILKDERVIYQIGNFILLVPFWAEWPYEMYIIPTVDISSIDQLNNIHIKDLAKIISIATKIYANFFQRPLNGAPYMMSISQKPTAHYKNDSIQLFIKFICPLLTPTRTKYQAGYEKSAEPQRDITPEQAASQLINELKNI